MIAFTTNGADRKKIDGQSMSRLTVLKIRRPCVALIPRATNVVNNPITAPPYRPHTDSELMLNNAQCLQARLQDVLYTQSE